MSAALLGLAWAAKVGESKTRKLVLMKLVDCCDDEGSNIYPALATVAEHVGCSTQQVRRELKRFCEVGLLRKVRDGGKGKGSTARYELDIDMLARLRRGDIWPVLEAAALHDPLPESADDDDAHAPDAKPEAQNGAGHAQSLGDMVSPLHGVRVTSDPAKGDSRCHPTPYLEPSDSERERASANAQEDAGSRAEPDEQPLATLDEFRKAYPHAGADDQAALTGAWQALPIAERRQAIDGVGGFLAERKAAGFHSRLSAPKYLAGRNWRHVPQQTAERKAQAASSAVVTIDGWSRDWWLLLFDRLLSGRNPGLWMQFAEARKPMSTTGADLGAAAKRVGELKPYLCTGPEIEAWRPWLAAKGARIPPFSGDFRVFLPSETPPAGRREQGDDNVPL